MARSGDRVAVTRRRFLSSGGAAVVYLADCGRLARAAGTPHSRALTPWIAITRDNRVVVLVDKCEMGQGVRDLFAAIVAEELGLDPNDVDVEEAPVGWVYRNRKLLPLPIDISLFQLTGSSSSAADAWHKVRQGAAGTRQLLLERAAQRFAVTTADVALDGRAVRKTRGGGSVSFADLLSNTDDRAADATPTRDSFRRLGKSATDGQRGPRIDARDKITGRARFGIDVGGDELGQVPLTALVIRPDRPGDRVEIANAPALFGMPGLKRLVTLRQDGGIAVVADSFWHAFKARSAAEVRPVQRAGARPGSSAVLERYRAAAELPDDAPAPGTGTAAAVARCDALYETPYGAHAPMEPMTAACVVRDGRYHVYAATQFPDAARGRASGVADAPVVIHGMLAGGSFGRRAASDFIVEVVDVCRQLEGHAVKLIWTREDDFRHDYLRPCAVSRVRATATGRKIASWRQSTVSESANVRMGDEFAAAVAVLGPALNHLPIDFQWRRTEAHVDVVDTLIHEGVKDTLYEFKPELHRPKAPHPGIVQVGYWRSVGRFHTVFAVESMIDELAAAASANPIDFRLANLVGEAPKRPGARARLAWCVDRLAVLVGRDRFGRDGRSRPTGYGMACLSGWGSFAALAVEIQMPEANEPADIAVRRAWAAVDCGFAVCPDTLRQQVEGGIIFGLSAALKQEITTMNGVVQQTNFHACDALRIHECPEITVEYRRWSAAVAPTGVGELLTPLPAPAVANAVYNATGQRLRRLPLRLGGGRA